MIWSRSRDKSFYQPLEFVFHLVSDSRDTDLFHMGIFVLACDQRIELHLECHYFHTQVDEEAIMTDERYDLINDTQDLLSVDTWCAVLYTAYLADLDLDFTPLDSDAVFTEATCIWC